LQRIKKNDLKTKNEFLLVCLTRVWSCSYVSPGAMEKSNLRSSGARNVFVFFIIVKMI